MKADDEIVTRGFLRGELQDLRIEFTEKLNNKFNEADEKNRGYRDQILTALDKVAGELQSFREDKVLSDEKLEDYSVRLTKLESVTRKN